MFGITFCNPLTDCTKADNRYGVQASGQFQTGLSLVPPDAGKVYAESQDVHAFDDGTVKFVGELPSPLGLTVILSHGDGYETRYSHLFETADGLSIDGFLRRGEVLGNIAVGFTLWFEIRKDNKPINPGSFLQNINAPEIVIPDKEAIEVPEVEVDFSDLDDLIQPHPDPVIPEMPEPPQVTTPSEPDNPDENESEEDESDNEKGENNSESA